MQIDDGRIHTLTKYVTTRGHIKKSESDHNLMFCEFDMPVSKKTRSDARCSVFNFKDPASLEMFHEVSSECQALLNLTKAVS